MGQIHRSLCPREGMPLPRSAHGQGHDAADTRPGTSDRPVVMRVSSARSATSRAWWRSATGSAARRPSDPPTLVLSSESPAGRTAFQRRQRPAASTRSSPTASRSRSGPQHPTISWRSRSCIWRCAGTAPISASSASVGWLPRTRSGGSAASQHLVTRRCWRCSTARSSESPPARLQSTPRRSRLQRFHRRHCRAARRLAADLQARRRPARRHRPRPQPGDRQA